MDDHIAQALAVRGDATEQLFESQASRIAGLCHSMAERFARGGRLIAVGVDPCSRTDVDHVAVEFVHPVIVGKRALPAIGLTGEKAPVCVELELLVGADDIVLAVGDGDDGDDVRSALALANGRGALTVSFAPLGAAWELEIPATDPFVRQELGEVLYHVVWELVHVFFEHRGLLAGRDARPTHQAGASGFLYPFLAEQETDLQGVLDDVAESAIAKAREAQALRVRTLTDGQVELLDAASALRASLDGGGRLLTFGNGGSATDAADAAVDFTAGGAGRVQRPVLDLTQSSAVLTAIGNDIGPAAMLSRQLIAHGRPGDVLLVFSTSGASTSVIEGLAEARRRGIASVALIGYDGGDIARDRLADHVIVAPSQHIPRIQEAHATAAHLLCELVDASPAA